MRAHSTTADIFIQSICMARWTVRTTSRIRLKSYTKLGKICNQNSIIFQSGAVVFATVVFGSLLFCVEGWGGMMDECSFTRWLPNIYGEQDPIRKTICFKKCQLEVSPKRSEFFANVVD